MPGEWTPERRAAAAARIHGWKPWEYSTGPVTGEGKAVASQNRFEGALRPAKRALRREVRAHMKAIDGIECDMEVILAQELAAAIEGMRIADQQCPRAPDKQKPEPAPAPTGEI